MCHITTPEAMVDVRPSVSALRAKADVLIESVGHRALMETLPALARPFVMQTELVQGENFALPAGTVTFLLTDVEGSTRLWEERPGEMSVAIARHYDMLGEAITAHHGVRPVEQGEG